jgi:hypothetical protein
VIVDLAIPHLVTTDRRRCDPAPGPPPTIGGMRLVIARCQVDYAGRLTAHLPMATRLIMVKADGCVAIHADGGATSR